MNKVIVEPTRSSPRFTSGKSTVGVVGELNNGNKVTTAIYKRYNHHLCMHEICFLHVDNFSSPGLITLVVLW